MFYNINYLKVVFLNAVDELSDELLLIHVGVKNDAIHHWRNFGRYSRFENWH